MQTLLSSPSILISKDSESKIIELRWNGVISADDCKEALVVVKNNLEQGTSLIVNRTQLIDFDATARKWILHVLMRSEAKKVTPYLSKLATVEPETKVRVFAKAINQLGSLIFPNLEIASFNTLEDAIAWVKEVKAEINTDDGSEVLYFFKKIIRKLKP